MRMSCNGCRVLRRGCSGVDCCLGACLQWINTPDSQANATLFLAKFYGRAGLFNLINAGPTHLRPQIFRSLLYEACGRITNPVYGAFGLLCSGNWARCRAAVDAVLDGKPLVKQAVKNRVEPDARFTITGLAGEIERETARPSLVNRPEHAVQGVESGPWPSEIGLELTLGRDPICRPVAKFLKSSGTFANL